MSEAKQSSARTVFGIRSYTLFWIARVCSAMSYQMVAVAVGWQLYAITHSTFALGMVGLTQFLPLLLLCSSSPMSGAEDR